MFELLYIIIMVVVAGLVLAILAPKAGFLLAKIEHYLTYAATALIIGVMVFICAEVVMRYAFNSPIPATWKDRSCLYRSSCSSRSLTPSRKTAMSA